MQLELKQGFSISDIATHDRDAYVEHLLDKQIYDQTLAIPFPYTHEDADNWIARVAADAARLGESVNWAIREPGGELVGGIGFFDAEPGKSHRAEVGYWLARPHWGVASRIVV